MIYAENAVLNRLFGNLGLGSLNRLNCNMLCTSGFVDDVVTLAPCCMQKVVARTLHTVRRFFAYNGIQFDSRLAADG